ncbi:hypothetical protein GCM10010971_39580 [Silvimonas amylolytica]|uniref:Uncharacterized protein n=1 Tax=Silvimonas amylolytica TaxID=449663 RepID=A0ABQ2PT71_9NEIS|nr:hypothetical protein GCM10010971_39580 [Silvimonas amylolytica]
MLDEQVQQTFGPWHHGEFLHFEIVRPLLYIPVFLGAGEHDRASLGAGNKENDARAAACQAARLQTRALL